MFTEILQVSGVPFRLDDVTAISIIFAVIIACSIHFIREIIYGRRGQRWNIKFEETKRYDKVQIVIHWLFLILLFALLLTGLFIFKTDYFISIYPLLGEINLRLLIAYHWYISIALLDLAIIHIFYDSLIIKKIGTVWITRLDITNLVTILKNFFVITKDYPKMKKLHPLQKIFHLGLVIVIFFLGFTGLTIWEPFLMFLRNIGLNSLENWFYIYDSRYLHDLFTFLFIGLMIGHFYFSVLVPTNWKVFRGMTHGQLITKSKKSEEKSK